MAEILEPQPQLLYSYVQARKMLGGLPKSTLAMWIRDGILEPVRIGPRRCFIRHADLVRLANGGPDLPLVG